jgi:alpha-tubulin suppressor-like RCC1 family protein
LNQNGEAFSFGNNNVKINITNKAGQLGIGTNINTLLPSKIFLNSLVKISAGKGIGIGNSFSIVLNQNGQIYSFGNNDVKLLLLLREVSLVLMTLLVETHQR